VVQNRARLLAVAGFVCNPGGKLPLI